MHLSACKGHKDICNLLLTTKEIDVNSVNNVSILYTVTVNCTYKFSNFKNLLISAYKFWHFFPQELRYRSYVYVHNAWLHMIILAIMPIVAKFTKINISNSKVYLVMYMCSDSVL